MNGLSFHFFRYLSTFLLSSSISHNHIFGCKDKQKITFSCKKLEENSHFPNPTTIPDEAEKQIKTISKAVSFSVFICFSGFSSVFQTKRLSYA